ncbi:MAG: hypothetical protein AAF530_05555 [Pseudomonadota bacterium]
MTLPFIDLERYPIDQPQSPAYQTLLDQCHAGLDRIGAAVLDRFLLPDPIKQATQEVAPHLSKAFYKTKSHSPYLIADDPDLAPEHPRNRKQMTNSATLGYDLIPQDSLLNQLYLTSAFQDFLADVLGFDKLYPYADNLTPLNILVYQPGNELGWHFDVSTFVVTLALQACDKGGEFLYAPFIRSDEDENYGAVDQVLSGSFPDLKVLRQDPGCLVIFRGSRTLHRVTRVEGERDRLMAVFSYTPKPGTYSDPHNLKTFYGRTS